MAITCTRGLIRPGQLLKMGSEILETHMLKEEFEPVTAKLKIRALFTQSAISLEFMEMKPIFFSLMNQNV